MDAPAESLLDQAGGHVKARRFGAAALLVNQALALEPDNARALSFAAIIEAAAGRREAALAAIGRAMELAPDSPGAANNAACIYFQLGEVGRALPLWQGLFDAGPSAEVSYNLALCRLRLGDPDRAADYFRKTLELNPAHRGACANLGNLLKSAGRIEEAIGIFRQGLRRNPGDLATTSNLLYALHFAPSASAEEIGRQHREFGRAFEASIPAASGYANDRSAERPLRIGYLSPNFRDHAVTYFVLSLLSHIDRGEFSTHCYSCNAGDDGVTTVLRSHADSWRHCAGLSDAGIAEQVAADRIDILVDLTMHMHGNRLGVFARKPAPVQAAWVAYPGTTGLSRMDYTVLDPHLDTVNPAHYTEARYILPHCYWCYGVYGPRPDVSPLPARSRNGITFGCLNHFGKVTRQTLLTWGEILRRVPESRLVLYVESASAAEGVRALFAQLGVAPERVSFLPRLEREKYLHAYDQIDIALDPFPYNGATTTCDALWMGVPVVSIVGTTAVARAGLSILTNLGSAEWVASSIEQYIAIAAGLAGDVERLSELRGSLRGRLERSPVMNAPLFARGMEKAYRWMWTRWRGK